MWAVHCTTLGGAINVDFDGNGAVGVVQCGGPVTADFKVISESFLSLGTLEIGDDLDKTFEGTSQCIFLVPMTSVKSQDTV